MARITRGNLPDRLREIATLDRSGCVAAWRAAFGAPPPSRLRPDLMRRVLAHDLQCRVLGGLTASERRALQAIAAGQAPSDAVPAQASPGVHLVREWNGRTYRVETTADGYVLDGSTYRSLSAVAKRITGTAWSGPRFFGLAGKRSA